MKPLAIMGGRIVSQAGITRGDVLIKDRRIAAISQFDIPADADRIDAANALIAPGIVDVGSFAIDIPAFVAGGITRAGLMPDQSPPLDNAALIQRAGQAGKPDVWISPIAAATRGLEGLELAELGLMKMAGATSVATGRRWIANSGVMYRLLDYAASLDLMVISHAEDDCLVGQAVATDGETATRLGLASAPAVAEAMAVARDIALAEETGAHLHFRQLSTAKAFDLVRAAKTRGARISCGVNPAHLLLSDIAISGFRTFARLSPPLRDEADRQAALKALADGTVDILCSGHDPQGPEAKRLPFADAAPGMAGAETLLTLSLGLVRDGLLDLPRLFTLLSANPAQLLGVPGGWLEIDSEADLILFDPDRPWRIVEDELVASAGNTPFDGLPVQGRVLKTIKGGQPIG
jgi:dihydroorotase